MFEPSLPSEPTPPPPPPRPPTPTSDGRGLSLIDDVRAAQARAYRTQGVFYGVAAFLVLLFAGALLAHVKAGLGLAVLVLAPLTALTLFLLFGVVMVRRRVGDTERTARLLAERAPELSLDLLAAVELSRAMGRRDDFSPELATAFLRDVDRRAARLPVEKLLDSKPVSIARWTLAGTLLAGAITLGMVAEHVVSGVVLAVSREPVNTISVREPITGDFSLSYRYPDYTHLEPRTVRGTAGDISAPQGTEVAVTTRADRDVDEAVLIVNGTRVPLTVSGRDLAGTFIVDAAGQYHVAFVDGDEVEAEGPDLPIQVEADASPQVRLLAPIDTLELDPATKTVALQFEASDDFGLSALELVFKAPAGGEKRVPLQLDELRTVRGTHTWDVAALALKPGAEVRYFLEAKDGNTVRGAQKGVSATHVLKLYSAAEHRRDALRRAEALWERLVTHLGDRLEAADRKTPLTPEATRAGQSTDERAAGLSKSLGELAETLGEEREPLPELTTALTIIGSELESDTRFIASRRAYLLRNVDSAARNGGFDSSLAFALTSRLSADIATSEKNVLYLEALLDRARLNAIRDLANQLKEDRRELTRLVEELQRSSDPAVKDALLEQIDQLKERMHDLQQRMSELAKGLRDEFMNQEALQEMAKEENLGAPLEEIERLVREGKVEEALKKMQELSMQLDSMLEAIEQGADDSDANSDPELTEQFQAFDEDLRQTVEEQERVAEATKKLRDKARAAAKERIDQRGAQLKKELGQQLQELERSFGSVQTPPGSRVDEHTQKALNEVRNTQQALEAGDFDLAAEAARELAGQAQKLEDVSGDELRNAKLFRNNDALVNEAKRVSDEMTKDRRKAEEVAQRLEALFPPASQALDQNEQQQLKDLAKQQQKLGQKGQALKQQMQELGERAPLFDEDAMSQMDQAAQRMGSAGERLNERDPNESHRDQQGALQSLRALQQGLEQSQQSGGGSGKGMPRPMSGRGRSMKHKKIEIPAEDPAANPREFRKDVMDAMKQGAPDRYKEQNKKYYEELVK